ncbi:hypothetical protein [Sphingomonas oleivorans]|nr:hypothetical protein [Sphingomonas oleivorans]
MTAMQSERLSAVLTDMNRCLAELDALGLNMAGAHLSLAISAVDGTRLDLGPHPFTKTFAHGSKQPRGR